MLLMKYRRPGRTGPEFERLNQLGQDAVVVKRGREPLDDVVELSEEGVLIAHVAQRNVLEEDGRLHELPRERHALNRQALHELRGRRALLRVAPQHVLVSTAGQGGETGRAKSHTRAHRKSMPGIFPCCLIWSS